MTMIEYDDAPPRVRAVYDDIMRTRNIDWINNFWKVLANDPATLERTWASLKAVMAPGALDKKEVTKEMLYLAVSTAEWARLLLHRVAYGGRARGGHVRCDARRTDGRGRDGERDQRAGEGLAGADRQQIKPR